MAYAFLAKLKKKSTYDTDYAATKWNPNQTNTNSQNNIIQQSKPRSQMLSWTGHGCYPLQSDPRWWHFCTDCGLQSKKSGQQPCIWIWKDSYISELSLHILCVPCLCREKNSIGGLLPKRIVRSQDSLLQLQPNHQQSPFEASHRQQLVSWIKGWEVMNPRDEAQRLRWATCSLLKVETLAQYDHHIDPEPN